jgi:hypothetical protein
VFNFIKATALCRKIAIEEAPEKVEKYFSDLRSIVSEELQGTGTRGVRPSSSVNRTAVPSQNE